MKRVVVCAQGEKGRAFEDMSPEAIKRRVASNARRATVEVFRNEPPTTVIGYLLVHKDPEIPAVIALETGLELDYVEASVTDLEAESLVTIIEENGLEKIQRLAQVSLKKGHWE